MDMMNKKGGKKIITTFFIASCSISRIGYALSTAWQHLIPFKVLDRFGIFRRIRGFKNVFIEDVDLFKKLNRLDKTKYFTHFHVITSSRRLEKMGILGTLDYYCDISEKWNGVTDFSKRYINVG